MTHLSGGTHERKRFKDWIAMLILLAFAVASAFAFISGARAGHKEFPGPELPLRYYIPMDIFIKGIKVDRMKGVFANKQDCLKALYALVTQYDELMDVCRDHNPPECELFGEFWDVMMTTPEDLDEYLRPKRKRKKR